MMGCMWSVRSSDRNPGYSLCADNTAVGSGHTWHPIAESTGIATVSDARPYPEMS